MIGRLKSKNTRTVRQKKVVRIKIDVPYQEMSSGRVDEEAALEWLDHRVGSSIGFELTALEDQDQANINL